MGEIIGHFPVALNLIVKARLSAKLKISFHSYANKTNFHDKNFALSLAFITRFTATRKWPILSVGIDTDFSKSAYNLTSENYEIIRRIEGSYFYITCLI